MAEAVEIFAPNIIALFLLLGIVRFSRNVIIGTKTEAHFIRVFVLTLGIVILLDTVNRIVEGSSGQMARVIFTVSTFLLFFFDIIFSQAIMYFILGHVYERVQKWFVIYTIAEWICAIVLLVINYFAPIIFVIDSDNYYHDGSMYYLFVLVLISVIPAGTIAYVTDKNRIGTLEFFSPVFITIPVVIGEVLSELCGDYVSTILPMLAVSVVFMFFSILHENVYRDKLTGLYNRLYLDKIVLQKKAGRKGAAPKAVLMMDLNYFKSINDVYGHSEGDEALKNMASLLSKSVVGRGKAIRYAGDEFMVALQVRDENEVREYIAKLRESVETFNQTSGKEYELAIAVGYGIFNLSTEPFDEVLKVIDEKMYEDKEAYYAVHKELARRK